MDFNVTEYKSSLIRFQISNYSNVFRKYHLSFGIVLKNNTTIWKGYYFLSLFSAMVNGRLDSLHTL